MLIELILKFIC